MRTSSEYPFLGAPIFEGVEHWKFLGVGFDLGRRVVDPVREELAGRVFIQIVQADFRLR